MLIKPFDSLFSNRPSIPSMTYIGVVEDNEDPKKLGRLRVRIEPYTDYKTDELPWANPTMGQSGNSPSNCGLNIPEKGSQVRVYFPSKDLTAPYYTGAELNDKNRSTFFDDDYPNSYGYKDSKGNFVRVNKVQETIHLQHSSGTNFKTTSKGDVQLELSNGPFFTLNNTRNFELSLESGVDVKGTGDGFLCLDILSDLELQANKLEVNAPVVEFTQDVKIGTGASGILWCLNGIAFIKDGFVTSIRPFGS